ncbi:glycosyltransferase family 2 protein [Myroides sp. NP-2]|uniref:glycosyltransferase family 2 protein n=1 Tax=Myroides sp. NP-2 TaxID=2759945 RepID=UPI0015FB1382|nr:glycosyltransferase family A protein [Myroides sp. NP-2]MBB1150242.1 glycosyltransferase family 2 protein [Myroides sp. NP-2]
MKYIVLIPAYNEANYIEKTLQSLAAQTLLPTWALVINDGSTDQTAALVAQLTQQYPWLHLCTKTSQAIHLPGSKVIQAFNYGLTQLPETLTYDFIVKLDADLILPQHYFEAIAVEFQQNKQLGMAGGVALIEKDKQWIVENLTDKDHIRGAFKAYRKACFEQIGGLQPAMGWDTVDELLCRYYQWEICVRQDLQIKHLKPTGAQYDKTARYKQGEAFYRLHYGLTLTLIASLKLAMRKKKPLLCLDYIRGYFIAKAKKMPFLVNQKQGKFIRQYRWIKIKSKLF